MKRILFIYAIAVFISACANHKRNHIVNDIVENMEKYDESNITVKGYLRISESFKKTIYDHPKSNQFLDLAFYLEILPREKYIPEKFYCVIVRGKFTQYTEDLILLGAISPYGRIDVQLVEDCE